MNWLLFADLTAGALFAYCVFGMIVNYKYSLYPADKIPPLIVFTGFIVSLFYGAARIF